MHYFNLTTFRAFLLVLGMTLPGLSYGQQTANFNPVFQANGQSLFEANGGTPAGLNLDKQFLSDGKVSYFVDESILDLSFLKGGLEFGAYFQLKELNGGQVDITYPLDITIQYPEANTFGCNDWVEITTDCAVGAGYNPAVTPPTLDFELGTSFTGGVSASIGTLEEISAPDGLGSATSSNWQDFGDGWEDPFFSLNTNTGITWPWDYVPGLSAPSGTIPGSFPVTIPTFIEDAIFLGGTIDNPFAGDGPDNLTGKKLSDTSLKNFVNIDFRPLNFQQYFTGIPLSIGLDAVIASVDFTAFDTPLGLEIAQRREVEFEGEVNIQFTFSQTLEYEEVDPGTNSVVKTGTGSTATYSNGTNLTRWETRYETGAPHNDTHLYAYFPFWLRIVRQGTWFRGYYRNAGNNWVLIHQVYMELPECVEVGIATFTAIPNGNVNAVVSNVAVQGTVPSLAVSNEAAEMATDNRARIFPNPSDGQFTVELGQPTPLPITVSLRNTMGQIIEQRQFEPGTQQLSWQTQNLPNDLYFMEIPESDGTTQTLKWMKQ